MKSRPKINRRSMWISALAILTVLAFWYLVQKNNSPGDVAAAHSLPGLVGPGRCDACHGKGARGMRDSCLECHEEIDRQLSQRKGFHGLISADAAGNCAKCHSEHHGGDFRMINRQSFALAGIDDPERFDHAGLDFALTGKHLQIACDGCHPFAAVDVLPKDQKRFLGLNQQCESCHRDVHRGNFGADCGSCHGQSRPFDVVAEFEHTTAFQLDGAHGNTACVDCHEPGTNWGIDAHFARRRQPPEEHPPVRACQACHGSPHSDSLLVAVARVGNSPPGQSCEHCHPGTDESFLGQRESMAGNRHAVTGFPLAPPHDAVSCESCHQGFGEPKTSPEGFQRAYPGRHADDCAACHVDPHQGQFADTRSVGPNCLACHGRDSFRPSTFGLQRHAESGFPLRGAHQAAECQACHGQPDGPSETTKQPAVAARVFRGTPTACRACHGDPHDGQFEYGSFAGGDCRACHNENAFLPPAFTVGQHDRTRFPLIGAHAAVACRNCHLLGRTHLATDGRMAPVRVFYDTPSTCRACHGDPHVGQFEYGPFAGGDCRACHNENAFCPPAFTIGQHDQTRFPLTGAHAAVACHNCHLLGEVRVAAGGRTGRLRVFHDTPSACRTCHGDIHGGSFDRPGLPVVVDGREGCARCHRTDRFDELWQGSFDHQTWTGYELVGAHARAECAGCHERDGAGEWRGRAVGPGTDTRCQSCHQDPHVGQFGPTVQVDCSRCHLVGESFADLAFDHQRDSRFPLDDEHAGLACSACHKPQPVRGWGTAVRYKPLGTVCGDCHDPRGPTGRSRGNRR